MFLLLLIQQASSVFLSSILVKPLIPQTTMRRVARRATRVARSAEEGFFSVFSVLIFLVYFLVNILGYFGA